jgi:hypothetical protein
LATPLRTNCVPGTSGSHLLSICGWPGKFSGSKSFNVIAWSACALFTLKIAQIEKTRAAKTERMTVDRGCDIRISILRCMRKAVESVSPTLHRSRLACFPPAEKSKFLELSHPRAIARRGITGQPHPASPCHGSRLQRSGVVFTGRASRSAIRGPSEHLAASFGHYRIAIGVGVVDAQ